jgi:hypothetical protein
MGSSIMTGFTPTGISTSASYPAAGGAPPIDPFILEQIRRKMALQEQRQAQRDAMEMAAQREALRGSKLQNDVAMREFNQPQFTHAEGSSVARKAKGKPVFTKAVGGAGMIGGNIRLNQWEPGAAFAGYEEDLGSGPEKSSFQPGGADTIASTGGLGAPEENLNERVSAQRIALTKGTPGSSMGGGDFERARMAGALTRSNDEFDDRARVADERRKLALQYGSGR